MFFIIPAFIDVEVDKLGELFGEVMQ